MIEILKEEECGTGKKFNQIYQRRKKDRRKDQGAEKVEKEKKKMLKIEMMISR